MSDILIILAERDLLKSKLSESEKLLDQAKKALGDITTHYCKMVDSGDCGHWNPENDIPVIQAKESLKAIKEWKAAPK